MAENEPGGDNGMSEKTMTPEQVDLLKEGMKVILAEADAIAALFYKRLFTLDPALRVLLRRDMKAQGKKLMATLALLTHDLDRPQQFLSTARQLGRRHVSYGVQPEDYRQVGQALLWALAQVLGDEFTPAVEDAWTAAYNLIAKTMQEAAAETMSRNGL